MDDDMEDEIVYELFTAHIHIIWRYLGVTSAGLVELIMPGPGETFKTKMFQPGPFMFLMFLVLVASVTLQSSSHLIRHWLIKAPYLLGLNSVADSTFKKIGVGLDLASSSDNVVWEFNEGIAAVYGMQGRRGNMEDRFSILQDVDVGGKKMSFFGVYDGHGGQFTAEYVKENLFRNTIEKIRQLRSQLVNGKSSKTSSTSVTRKNSKPGSNNNNNNNNNITVKRNNSNKVSEKKSNEENKIEKTEKDHQTSDSSSSDDNIETKKNEKNTPTKTPSKDTPKDKEPQKDSTTTTTPKKVSPSETDKEATTKVPTGSCVETLSSKPSEEENTCSNDVSHKKDDNYTNLGLLKRNSISKCSGGSGNGEVPSAGSQSGDSQEYMDSYGNLNYTRLLTDQILAVDRKIVHLCKSHSDMSGTTAVVGVLDGELLVIANVGDSRAVMGDARGFAVPLSFDHKPNQLKERRRIKEAGGFISFTGVWRVAGVLATSRALGDFPLKEPRPLITAEPDVLTFSLRDHKAQFVILATDGLWDVMSNEEAVSFIAARLSQRDHGASALAHHAYVRGSQDNITIAVLVLGHLTG